MVKIITQVARDICNDKPVVLLSGGSNPWVAQQITSIVAILADLPPLELSSDQVDENPEDIRTADKIINKLLKEVI